MEFELLSKLLPHEISKYVIETLDTRLDDQTNSNLNKLSDHRSLYINRNVLTQKSQNDKDVEMKELQEFGSCSASCRIGSNSLVLGQLCIKESNKVVVKDKLIFNLKLSLQKDFRG